LTGSLDRVAVSDVIQFVNAIQETGILDISGDRSGSVRRGLFDKGEIVDAYDGTHQGEDAVREILNNKEGSFTFIRGEVPPCDKTVNKPTVTILMEQVQAYDEKKVRVAKRRMNRYFRKGNSVCGPQGFRFQKNVEYRIPNSECPSNFDIRHFPTTGVPDT
jgi:hypothetical protein